jgi:hypothetical protein
MLVSVVATTVRQFLKKKMKASSPWSAFIPFALGRALALLEPWTVDIDDNRFPLPVYFA